MVAPSIRELRLALAAARNGSEHLGSLGRNSERQQTLQGYVSNNDAGQIAMGVRPAARLSLLMSMRMCLTRRLVLHRVILNFSVCNDSMFQEGAMCDTVAFCSTTKRVIHPQGICLGDGTRSLCWMRMHHSTTIADFDGSLMA